MPSRWRGETLKFGIKQVERANLYRNWITKLTRGLLAHQSAQRTAQPHSQGLSSLPPLVVGTETLVGAGHVTTQNLGGVFYRPLDQMFLSIHPPPGFGWIDGHLNSRNQGLCSND